MKRRAAGMAAGALLLSAALLPAAPAIAQSDSGVLERLEAVRPKGVALTPNGRARYLSWSTAGAVVGVDLASERLLGGGGKRFAAVAITPSGEEVWALVLIDCATARITVDASAAYGLAGPRADAPFDLKALAGLPGRVCEAAPREGLVNFAALKASAAGRAASAGAGAPKEIGRVSGVVSPESHDDIGFRVGVQEFRVAGGRTYEIVGDGDDDFGLDVSNSRGSACSCGPEGALRRRDPRARIFVRGADTLTVRVSQTDAAKDAGRRLSYSLRLLDVGPAPPALAPERLTPGVEIRGALASARPRLPNGSVYACFVFEAPAGSVVDYSLDPTGFEPLVAVGSAPATCESGEVTTATRRPVIVGEEVRDPTGPLTFQLPVDAGGRQFVLVQPRPSETREDGRFKLKVSLAGPG